MRPRACCPPVRSTAASSMLSTCGAARQAATAIPCDTVVAARTVRYRTTRHLEVVHTELHFYVHRIQDNAQPDRLHRHMKNLLARHLPHARCRRRRRRRRDGRRVRRLVHHKRQPDAEQLHLEHEARRVDVRRRRGRGRGRRARAGCACRLCEALPSLRCVLRRRQNLAPKGTRQYLPCAAATGVQ